MSYKPLIPIGSFARDNFIRNCLLVSAALIFFQLLHLLLMYSKLPPTAPLFYSLVKGENQLASKAFLAMLPFTNIIFFLTHTYLAKINFQLDRIFSRLVTASSVFISCLFTIALWHIIVITT